MTNVAVKLLSAQHRRSLELFTLENGTLALKPIQGECPHRAFVISIQKSGTYLLAKLLEELGLVDLETHIWLDGFSDYRGKSLEEKVTMARNYTVDLPVEVTASLIQEGQFAVGHLYHEWRTVQLLSGFVRLVTIRDARDALASMMRFELRRLQADPLRNPSGRAWIHEPSGQDRMRAFLETMGGQLINDFEKIQPWWNTPGTIVVRFEQLLGDLGRDEQLSTVRAIIAALDLSSRFDPERILSRSLFQQTLTYSGARSQHKEFWSPKVDDIFKQLGGDRINAAMGYPLSHES